MKLKTKFSRYSTRIMQVIGVSLCCVCVEDIGPGVGVRAAWSRATEAH